MSLDRIQPSNAINPLWDKENATPPKKDGAVPAPANAPTTAARDKGSINRSLEKNQTANPKPGGQSPRTNIWGNISQESISRLQSVSEKVQAVGAQSQLNEQISNVGQDIVITQQELAQATRAQENAHPSAANSSQHSYWDSLSVSEKARTINQLKDKLQNMQLQQSQLQNQLTDAITSGTYAVSGDEIVKGMLDA